MADWSKYPFFRMLIPLALGMLCAYLFPSSRLPLPVLVCMMLVFLGGAVAASAMVKTLRFSWLFGVIMSCYLFMGGYALLCSHEAQMNKHHYRASESEATHYVARIYDCPTERPNSIRAVLELEYQLGDSLPLRPVSGKVMAYFSKPDSAFALRYGDLITIEAPIGEVAGPKNPGEFDYRSYLFRRGITGQVYIKEGGWMDLNANEGSALYAFSYRFRDELLTLLQRSGLSDDEFGVAAAVLLGYDDKLADEVRSNYVAAGAMHILCVSGLHVGIIYLLASFLLGFLDRKRSLKVLKQILLLALIWFYALIAGLSPSILRASMMISFVIIGELIHRKGFILNSIAASAFVLLCINPYNLFEVGFQLSYAAVVGIVVLHRPIYNLLYVKNKFLDKVWSITALSVAAQLGTIPFTLFYFSQLSTYFWLSNLFVTPLSFAVVISGMVLLLLAWVPYLGVLLGRVVWAAVYAMNWVVAKIESLPISIIKGVYVNGFEFAMLFLAFILLLVSVAARKRRVLIGMLSVLLLCMVSVTVRTYSADRQNGMMFYSLRKHTAVDFVAGHQHVLLADSTLMADASTVDYSLKGAWAQRQLSQHPYVIGLEEDYEDTRLRKRQNLISFDEKLLALWDGQRLSDSLTYRLPVDYLMVVGKQKPDVRSIVYGYDVKTLLIDGSVPGYLAERWMGYAAEMGLPYINIGDGALGIGF